MFGASIAECGSDGGCWTSFLVRLYFIVLLSSQQLTEISYSQQKHGGFVWEILDLYFLGLDIQNLISYWELLINSFIITILVCRLGKELCITEILA